jgi:predicted nucleotidyltransferase
MPVRSSDSFVIKWPGSRQVDQAVRRWADDTAGLHPELLAVGYFGSYARGNWGVGSDVDLVAIVGTSSEPFHRRPLAFNLLDLPVPADLLVYTMDEWQRLLREENAFVRRVSQEAVWVCGRATTG